MSRGVLRALSVLSIVELLSIAILLVNLTTAHWRPITASMGPIHGAAYLCVAMVALLGRGLELRTRLMALIPVAGGVLTLWNVRRERRRLSEEE
jgi:hypothetical protein